MSPIERSGGGTGTVTSVTAADGSIVVGGTPAAPTIATGTLDVIATQHPPSADVPMNSRHLTGLSEGNNPGDSLRWEDLTTGSGPGTYSSTFDIVSTSALSALISRLIPANTLGANGALICIVEGFYLNNTGAARGLRLNVALGTTNFWDDTTSATFFPSTATVYPFFWQFMIANEGAANAQRVSGIVMIGNPTAASSTGTGTIAGVNNVTATFHGTAAEDTTAARTLLVRAAHSAASGSLELRGSIHVRVT